jgi:hypothetical protein
MKTNRFNIGGHRDIVAEVDERERAQPNVEMIFFIVVLLVCVAYAQQPVMVKDVNPGPASSIIKSISIRFFGEYHSIERLSACVDDNAYPFESKFAAVGNRLYFACDDGTGKGEELCTRLSVCVCVFLWLFANLIYSSATGLLQER